MSDQLDLVAEYREDLGKGASRRLRRQGKVPAIVYGGGRPPRNIVLDENKLLHQAQNESFFSSVLTVKVGDRTQPCILKDIQVHPAKRRVLHLDLQRIVADEKIRMTIPLHFLNAEECPGVKLSGGTVSQIVSELEISCLPASLPEYIEVDLVDMQLDQIVHLSDVKVPDGVEIIELTQGEGHDQPVVSCSVLRAASVEDDEAVEGVSEEGSEDSDTSDEDNDKDKDE
jgi:large subunit ribosomal protein L25